jgi:hypothetical protein
LLHHWSISEMPHILKKGTAVATGYQSRFELLHKRSADSIKHPFLCLELVEPTVG